MLIDAASQALPEIRKRRMDMSDREQSIEQLIYDETDRRLAQMEQPDYEFPAKAGKADYVVMAAAVLISLILIILCMTGVIS